MMRDQLEHVIRAASRVTGVPDLLVIGSAALLGTFPDRSTVPAEAVMSVEADLAVDPGLMSVELAVDAAALADLIDGALGELSQFHQTFGYYAQGVEVATAVLTPGWRERLVPVICETEPAPVVGWCLGMADLWVSKAAAGRSKDLEYCRALAQSGLVEREPCERLIQQLSGGDAARARNTFAAAFPQ